MIINMPNTATRDISEKVDELHEERGEAATGRVLTLLIVTTQDEIENALTVANTASREHPCRVIAIVPDHGPATEQQEDKSNLDAQVRFGADAGAGEVIILRPRNGLIHHLDTLVIPLLVPDAPVVTWWPTNPPSNPSQDPLGVIANSHITDALRSDNPELNFEQLRKNWSSRDIDLSWTRLTVWRAMLASMLEQPPHDPITQVKVTGPRNFLPMNLLCSWLRLKLSVPVTTEYIDGAEVVTGVFLTRSDGIVSLERPGGEQATNSLPGQTPQSIAMPPRTLEDCLNEELRRIDPDELYADVISTGWELFHNQVPTTDGSGD